MKHDDVMLITLIVQKGSELTKDFACIMSEMYFPAGTQIKNLIKAIHNPEERLRWDKDIESAEVLSIVNSKLMLWHQMNKSPISFI